MTETQNIPACVGVIIDGNRRWATSQGLPSEEGHRAGAERLKEFVRWAHDAGITYVISYTFSTENWKRSKEEVTKLMNLLRSFLKNNLKEMIKEEVRVRIVGQRERFAEDIQKLFDEVEEKTKSFAKGTLVFALSYGGRAELLDAVKHVVSEKTKEEAAAMTEEDFSKHLWTKDIPDPDMIIRTGGEKRLSNFLPWQSTYSELFFTDTLWPAFTKEEFLQMLDEFSHRERRRGK